MKFTHVSLAAALATVAFAEKASYEALKSENSVNNPSSEPEPVEFESVADCTEAYKEFDRMFRKKCVFERAIKSGRKNPYYAYEWHDTLESCDKFDATFDKYPDECVVQYAEKLDKMIAPPTEEHELLRDEECGQLNYFYKDVGNCLGDYVIYLNTRHKNDRFDVPEYPGCPHIINQYKKYPDKCARLLVDYHKKQSQQ